MTIGGGVQRGYWFKTGGGRNVICNIQLGLRVIVRAQHWGCV